jgi:GT2 family glycosyltransferase
MTAAGPRVSVIVPTYGDWEPLAGCLACLAAQTVAAEAVEIIVADNNPATAPAPDLALPANARIVREPAPGSYAARNAAAATATGAFLFFTDADCRPEPDWIAAGLAAFDADPTLGRAAGAIVMTAAGPDWTAPELYDRLFNLRQARYVARGYAATANLAVRRAVFERVGPFDAGLRSSGDKEWNGRATALGVPIAFVAAMRVRHPARASFEALAGKRARVAGGKAALHRKSGLGARLSLLRFALPSASAVRRILAEPGLTPAMRLDLLRLEWRLQRREGAARRALHAGAEAPRV